MHPLERRVEQEDAIESTERDRQQLLVCESGAVLLPHHDDKPDLHSFDRRSTCRRGDRSVPGQVEGLSRTCMRDAT